MKGREIAKKSLMRSQKRGKNPRQRQKRTKKQKKHQEAINKKRTLHAKRGQDRVLIEREAYTAVDRRQEIIETYKDMMTQMELKYPRKYDNLLLSASLETDPMEVFFSGTLKLSLKNDRP